jgi:hypothetical protein
MNSTPALTNSSKKKRRSSSVSSRRFHIANNKQAKLIISRKCRRVNLLDRNRHLNDVSLNNPNDVSNVEEMDVNSIKIEKQVPTLPPFQHQKQQLQQQKQTISESIVAEQSRANVSETIKTMAPTSRINDLKTKFANFKNNLVKSITNMKKPPPSHSNSNVKQEKSHIPQASTSSLRNSSTTSSTKLSAAAISSRKPAIMPLNENLNLKTINEQHKRLQNNVLKRSSSVSAFKHESKPFASNNTSSNANAVPRLDTMKQMRKFDSTSTCTLSANSLLQKSKENICAKPVFNQYAKINYNDRHLYQYTSVNLK